MNIRLEQDSRTESKNIWQMIRLRMNERHITPNELAFRTRRSKDIINKGLEGYPVEITLDFLRDCVMALNLTSGRTRFYEETEEDLSWQGCVDLLMPPPAMPPKQGNFWD